jgi:hypothetical protein
MRQNLMLQRFRAVFSFLTVFLAFFWGEFTKLLVKNTKNYGNVTNPYKIYSKLQFNSTHTNKVGEKQLLLSCQLYPLSWHIQFHNPEIIATK